MAVADMEAEAIKDLAMKTLVALYSRMHVWNLSVDEISKVNDKIYVKGIYSAEFKPELLVQF